jgi:hypothetical protein
MTNRDDEGTGKGPGARAMDLLRRGTASTEPDPTPEPVPRARAASPFRKKPAVAPLPPAPAQGRAGQPSQPVAGSPVSRGTGDVGFEAIAEPAETQAIHPRVAHPASRQATGARPQVRLFLTALILAMVIPSTPIFDLDDRKGAIADGSDDGARRAPPPATGAAIPAAVATDRSALIDGRSIPLAGDARLATGPGAGDGRAALSGTAGIEGAVPRGIMSRDGAAGTASSEPRDPGAAIAGSQGGSDAGGGTAATPEGQPPEDCPSETPKDPVVLVFDGSVSMGLPLDMPLEVESDLDRRMAGGDQSARLDYRRWLATEGPKRLEVAKAAVGEMLQIADPLLSIGAVAFTSCLEIATHGFVPNGGRSLIGTFIGGVTPHRGGETALTASIRTALDMITGAGRVVVLTDGQETCGGDLCGLAAETARNRPGVRIDVVDLSGRSNAACIAAATGGLKLDFAEMRERISLSQLLVQSANQCPARPGLAPAR